jgi:hypothetical protein
MHRFYNAGSKIDEVFPFSLPEGADIHVIGRWNLLAPKEGWFEVPRELMVRDLTIAVQFAQDIKRRFGNRGVVMLDPAYDPSKEDEDKPLESYPVAPTEELVIERAEKLWDNYLEKICQSHLEDVQNAMSSGGAPRGARGFTVHALKLKGYRDPAQDYFLGMKEGQQGKAPAGASAEFAGMMAQMAKQNSMMMSIVLALATGQKIDPELLKQAIVPENGHAAPTVNTANRPIPDNAGVVEVEGTGRTSLEQRVNRRSDDGYVRGEGNLDEGTLKVKNVAADKKGRAAAAVKAL